MIRIYVDSLLLAAGSTFALDLVVLWAVKQISGWDASESRLLGAAAFSTAVFVTLVGFVQAGAGDVRSGASFAVGLAAVGGSLVLAFPGMPLHRLARALVLRCFLTALAGGAATAAYSATRGSLAAAFIVAVAAVALAAEAGWGAVHRGIRDGLLVVPIQIDFGADRVTLRALIDTGNRLRDPVSGNPVIIVEYGAIEFALPTEVRGAWAKSGDDFEAHVRAIADSAWSSRFRAIPYSSVGRQRGMMVGLRPDRVYVANGRRTVITSRAVICVHSSALCPDGNYRALVNPDILAAA